MPRESVLPLITAVVPTYNVERYLSDFLSSIEAQTNDLENVEFLFVIDGSPDDSAEIIEAWLSKHPLNARVIRQENQGLAEARNTGLREARGNWVTFPDPDDMFESSYFDEVIKFMNLHDRPSLTVLAAHLMKTDDDGNVTDNHPSRKRFEKGSRVVNMRLDPVTQFGVNHAFLKTALLRETGLTFDSRIRPTFEDAHTVGRYLLRTGSHHIGLMASAKYFYRVRSDNSSLVQGGYDKPEKYTNVLRYGELDLLREAATVGPIPRWVENTVLYDLIWYFRNERGARSATAAAPKEILGEFHELAAEILQHISADAIREFSAISVQESVREVLLYGYAAGNRRPDTVQLISVDERHQLLQFAYWFTGDLPEERWTSDLATVQPAYETVEDVAFYDRVLVRRRVVWLVRGQMTTLTLDGKPVAFSRDAPLGQPHALTKRMLDPFIVGQREEVADKWALGSSRLELVRSEARVLRDRFLSARERRIRAIVWRARSKAARTRFADAWVFMDRDTDANDNAEHQYRWMKNNRPDVNSWFVLSKESKDWARLETEGFRLVDYKSKDWYSLILHAKHLASSHIDNYVVHPLPRIDFGRERFSFTFLQHGVIHNDLSRWLNEKDIDVFVTSTPDEKAAIAGPGPYKFSDREVVLTGLPRHDALLARREAVPVGERDLIVVMPTWRQSLVGRVVKGSNERLKHPDFDTSEYAQAFRALLTDPALHELAAKHGKRVAFMPHPNMKPYLGDFGLPESVEVLSFATDNVQDVLARSCAFVTDYTSVAFDAALLNIPVTYFQFDRDEFFNGLHVGRPGYFDHREDGFGPVVRTASEVVETLRSDAAANWQPAEVYLERERRAFVAADGKNRERVFTAMLAVDGGAPVAEPSRSEAATPAAN
ncbi:CDP-glycerol glycerophosphotransferase family protein [Curtobacterium sp. NPDC098951]|uniref:bifunctional glycosyltransferase/CDP-glycerol:glycerophosphate glycerophosphotransferase n=1 Tax=Curtobacterium sp. NPDC098951 TaxID=3363974 RepID=UPI00382EB43C